MPIVVALADDLTGALEVGARFAGARVAVESAPERWPRAPVLVVDAESRHLDAEAAACAVGAAARAARALAPLLVYKKTDSTLRGNLAAELRAVAEAFPARPLVYAPAYPAMGRTVRGGRLYVDGAPLEQTTFARDPLNPVHTGDIAALLGGLPVRVLDGETDADVEAAARAIASASPLPVAAGPAALAGALAGALDLAPRPPARWPALPRALVVNGSLHPASAAQVARLGEEWRVFAPAALAGEGLTRAAALADAVREELARRPVDALVVCGGDTARAIHRALGGGDFEPLGEVSPGVPLSRCAGRLWLTKAGGVGAPGILCDIQKRLR
jgi:uncharacterized protein YgbK (DUF1537 family)